jgi:hypothetical protein
MAIQVIAATYGTNTAGADVTAICQALVATGNDDILVENNVMGGDPDPGTVKSFGIKYTVNGAPFVRGGQEHNTIDLVP